MGHYALQATVDGPKQRKGNQPNHRGLGASGLGLQSPCRDCSVRRCSAWARPYRPVLGPDGRVGRCGGSGLALLARREAASHCTIRRGARHNRRYVAAGTIPGSTEMAKVIGLRTRQDCRFILGGKVNSIRFSPSAVGSCRRIARFVVPLRSILVVVRGVVLQ